MDLLFKKLSAQLVVNGFVIRIKKGHVLEIENKMDKPSKIKAHVDKSGY